MFLGGIDAACGFILPRLVHVYCNLQAVLEIHRRSIFPDIAACHVEENVLPYPRISKLARSIQYVLQMLVVVHLSEAVHDY